MTPFDSMVSHSLYYNSPSKNELTIFNWVGVSLNYNSVKGARNLLEGCAFELSENDNVPIWTHFTQISLAMGVFYNVEYSDKSLLTGTNSKHHASILLFLDASEKSVAKPPVSSTKVCRKVSSAAQLPCQVVSPYGKPPGRPFYTS